MLFLYFLIASAIFAIAVFFIRSRMLNVSIGFIYGISHILLSIYAYQHINSVDSVYFKFDSLSVLLNGLLSLILIPVLFHTRYYLNRHVPDRKMKGRFLSLMIVLSTAISGVYFSDNFLIIWVCLEITTIAVTFLIFHERYTDALEAAWKYLFISSFGITIAFLGILFLSVQSSSGLEASLSFSYLQSVATHLDPVFLKIAFLLLVTGYSIKLNLFPLYAATIDAKTAAPFPVNAIASTALINGGFVAVIRIYSVITKTVAASWAQHVLMIVGVLSLLIVSFQLFRVKRFKRMLAFSSMEHMALIAIALSLGKAGYYAALLHLVLHTLAKTGMFLNFGEIRACFQSGWIKDTGNYMKINGFSALIYLAGLLTITAIPPSGMFMSEFLLFKALLYTGNYFLFAAILILLTIIIYVLFKLSMQLLYGQAPDSFNPEKAIINRYEPVSQLVLFGLVFYLAYFPPALFTGLMNAALQILN